MSGVAIEGKVILITGTNRGIGKALASKALELGAKKVYATARDESKLAEVKALDSDRVVTWRWMSPIRNRSARPRRLPATLKSSSTTPAWEQAPS